MVSFFRHPPTVALLILALANVLLWKGPAPAAGEPLQPPLPKAVGEWQGIPGQVDARTLEILGTDDVALMEYRKEGEPSVWLSRVAGFGNRASYHPPELCFVGSHFQILEKGPIRIPLRGRARALTRLVVGQGGERFETWYWFTANGRMTPNYFQQQLWMVLDAIRRRPVSGTLVRISTRVESAPRARGRLEAFLNDFEMTRKPRGSGAASLSRSRKTGGPLHESSAEQGMEILP